MLHRSIYGLAITLVLIPAGLLAQGNAMRVTTQALGEVSIIATGRAPATVVAKNEALISAEIAGIVRAVSIDVGDQVEQGQQLVEIDPVDYQLQLDQAQAVLVAFDARIKQARERLRRAEGLSEQSFTSADELLSRQTDLNVLLADRRAQEVAVRTAQRNLDKTVITAPFAGTVKDRQAQNGQFATVGAPLLTLVQSDRRELDVDINPRDAASLQAAVELSFDGDGQNWAVRLDRLSDVIGSASRTRKARLQFVDGSPPVGASGSLVWRRTSLALPPSLLLQRDGRLGVFVADDGVARFIHLPTAQEGRPVVVSLPETTAMVIDGRDRLQDGQQIIAE
ncbi:MAG: hypothetical protein DHS20C11_33330 [Lysobacteraceae bacterium]|nr:MAG: hypothetical protein DHS20C11_33330 [Xanthomonadaceae bacterium]